VSRAASPGTAAALVIGAGVCAALHVGKLPAALPALREALGISLVQAGWLLSLVQLAGMSTGVAFGVLADGLGLRRSLLLGLLVLAPWLAHASWHAYTELVDASALAERR